MPAALKHDVFQAIADPTRRNVLRLLAREEMSISKISEPFAMSRTAVTKHLRVLADAGLVSQRKQGRERLYKIRPKPLLEVRHWLSFYERFWDDRIAALKDLVEKED